MGKKASHSSGFPSAEGASAYLWRLFGLGWLVFLLFPVADLIQAHPAPLRLAAGLSGTAIFAAVDVWVVLRGFYTPSLRARWTALALLVVLAIGHTLALGHAWLSLFLYAAVAAGGMLPPQVAFRAVGLLALLTAALGWAMSDRWLELAGWTLEVALIGCGMVGIGWLVATVRELRAARAEIARLAVANERLRFARDLHDLLGRSLSLIALKSELAGRLLPRDLHRAAQEIADVERVARQALREVREAVSGYRQAQLAAELAGARMALQAAGIECRVIGDNISLPPWAEAVLAWAVREGATNVIRHSGARACTIRLASDGQWAQVEVIDDGAGRGTPTHRLPGHGLPGLAERAAAHGGRLEAGPLPEGGFRLCVALPLDNAVAAPARESALP